MNAKQLFAASALVLAGVSALAAEGEQWAPTTGSLTRAEVKAELARAQAAGEVVTTSAAYGGFESTRVASKSTDMRSRDEVRSEARAALNTFTTLYVGG